MRAAAAAAADGPGSLRHAARLRRATTSRATSGSGSSSSSSSVTRGPRFEAIDAPKPVVALGKFSALHLGHRALVREAGSLGSPWLLSFSGMAEALGRPVRVPLNAPIDRRRIIAAWADAPQSSCDDDGNVDGGAATPRERVIPFPLVRSLTPSDFVDVLADELGASGVVCGTNFRFGHRATGTAEDLRTLGARRGLAVRVVDLVKLSGECDETISSSRIRTLLEGGSLATVSRMLGRRFRAVASLPGDGGGGGGGEVGGGRRVIIPRACFANALPGAGAYDVSVGCFPRIHYERNRHDDLACGTPGRLIISAGGATTLELAAGGIGGLGGTDGEVVAIEFAE